jgi:hypothetical protein
MYIRGSSPACPQELDQRTTPPLSFSSMMRFVLLFLAPCLIAAAAFAGDPADFARRPLVPVPETGRFLLDEDWSSGKIDPVRWYLPRRHWEDDGNNGVTSENVRIARDIVDGREQNVLLCEAHGDRYDGPVVGRAGKKTRVGGIIVSKAFFASGRYQVVIKIGSTQPHAGGPTDPRRPKGAVPAIWTFAYRWVAAPRRQRDAFAPDVPMYNPLMQRAGGGGANEYWSEIDFPEFGKHGNFDRGLYNTFCQNRIDSKEFDVSAAIDGQYHTLTTDWRTELRPIKGVTDAQVTEAQGYFWVNDKAVPFDQYYGNPLKRVDKDQYAVYTGVRADHWIDGKQVAENTRYLPAMAAQLTMGVWLPHWGGDAPWSTATVSFASVKVWQYDDPGDVRNVLTRDLPDNVKR